MINKINFMGRVFLAGSTKSLSPRNEVKKLKKIADKNKSDFVVFERDYYCHGNGVYKGILVKEDENTGSNIYRNAVYDTQNQKWTAVGDEYYKPSLEI